LSLLETPRHPRAAELHAARALALRSLWRAGEAIEAYRRAIESYVEAGNVAAAADASFHLGYIHLWKADGARAWAVADRAVKLLGAKPTLLRQRLFFLKAGGLGVKGDMEGSFAALSEAQQMETSLPDNSADGFASMCQARLHFHAAQMEQAAQFGREAIARFRAASNSWGEAEIFETITASVWLGRPREAEDALRDSLAFAERVGHKNAVWAYKGLD
jgi:tetratricopeptide (TPR) repeat protein